MNTDRSTVHCALIPRRRPVCCDANGRLAKVPTRLCRLLAAIIAAVVEEPRSLPPPWSVEEQPACFVVQRQIPRPMLRLRMVSFTRRGVIESWRQHYNAMCPHSNLGYLTPNEFVAQLTNAALVVQSAPRGAHAGSSGRRLKLAVVRRIQGGHYGDFLRPSNLC
jgi:hypothetical protein